MKICASLDSADELERCNTGMVEIRLDLLGDVPDTGDRTPLVTYRGPVDLSILPAGYSGMIDVGQEPRPDTGLEVVSSVHDYEGTPNAKEILRMLGSMDGDISKGAFKVRSFKDLADILEASAEVKRRHVLLGMGPMGTLTRVRSDILGNEFTFGYVGKPTAPGQLDVKTMERLADGCMVTGIVGGSLSKSSSPRMHMAAFEASGIPGIYLPFETDDLDCIEEVVRGYDIRGLNITLPHKQAIMDHLDRIDADASEIGAVNTVVNDGGILTGSNTDIVGIGAALEKAGFDVDGRRALVMGSGGAARACVYYLTKNGCDVTVTGRNETTGTVLASEFGASFRRPDSVPVMMHDLIVNCTPIGMYSDDPYPVSISSIRSGQAVFDMVYGRDTPLMRYATETGCVMIRGEDMLAGQGAASFEAWTGKRNVFDTMRDAI